MNSHTRFLPDRPTLLTPRFVMPTLAAAIASLAVLAAAESPTYVSAYASVTQPGGGPLTRDTGQLLGRTATTAGVSYSGAGQNSSAQVRAVMGDLGVRVFAGSAGFTSGATAVGIAKFSDDAQITSATSPFGTPVTLQFSMELDGTTTFAGQPSATGLDSSLFLIGQVAGVSHTYHELYRSGHAV